MIKQFILKYRSLFDAFLNFLNIIFVTIYVNSFTKESMDNKSGIFNSIDALGALNFLLMLIILVYFLQYKIHKIQENSFEYNKKEIINNILEANCIAITGSGSNKHIRAFFTKCDYRRKIRITINSYGLMSHDPETVSQFPLEFGVTGESYKTKSLVVRRICKSDKDNYPDDIKGIINPNLQAIMSIPIFDYYNPRKNKLVGFITFDSKEPMDSIGFEKEEIQNIGKACANLISQIICI